MKRCSTEQLSESTGEMHAKTGQVLDLRKSQDPVLFVLCLTLPLGIGTERSHQDVHGNKRKIKVCGHKKSILSPKA